MSRKILAYLLAAVSCFATLGCTSDSKSSEVKVIDGSKSFDFEDWKDISISDFRYDEERQDDFNSINKFWAFEVKGTYIGESTGILRRLVEGILGDDGILVSKFKTYERFPPLSFDDGFYSPEVVPGTTISSVFWFETDGAVKEVQMVLKSNGNTIYVKPGIAGTSEDSTSGKVCGDGGSCSRSERRYGQSSLDSGVIAYTPGGGAFEAEGINKLMFAASKNSEGSLCPESSCRYIEATEPWDYVAWSGIDDLIVQIRNGYREDFRLPNIEVLVLMCDYLFHPAFIEDCDLDLSSVAEENVYGDCYWTNSFRKDKVLGLFTNGSKIQIGLIDQKTECRVVLVSLF